MVAAVNRVYVLSVCVLQLVSCVQVCVSLCNNITMATLSSMLVLLIKYETVHPELCCV